jgi:tripartite-type tricarboxylate transporter receptor subunit TctC
LLPPNTPKERVQILRKALAATFKDPDFLADAQRARLDLNPLSGDELQEAVERLWKLDKPLVEKLKEILK